MSAASNVSIFIIFFQLKWDQYICFVYILANKWYIKWYNFTPFFFSFAWTECCLTSNLISRTVKSYSEHHFKYWLNKNHPVVLCVSLLLQIVDIANILIRSVNINYVTILCSLIHVWRLQTWWHVPNIHCIHKFWNF